MPPRPLASAAILITLLAAGAGCRRRAAAPVITDEDRVALAQPVAPRGRVVWATRGPGGGGAFFAPAISPHDAAELYVTSDMSAVYRSRDGGGAWAMVPFWRLGGGVRSQVRFTADPAVRFALSERQDRVGLARSGDGGESWVPIALPAGAGSLEQLCVDPAGTTRLLVSDGSALYSSSDGGASWARVLTARDPAAGLVASGCHFHGGEVFVGTRDGLAVSRDGGARFAIDASTGMPASEAIASFAGASAADGLTRLFAVTWRADAVRGGITGGDLDAFAGLYAREPGGPWRRAGEGLSPDDKLAFVATSGSEPEVLFVAGGDRRRAAPIVLRSDDGGRHLRRVLGTAGNANVATGWAGDGGAKDWGFAEYALGLAVRPGDSRALLLTDLGFVHGSSDGGASWRALYVAPGDRLPAGRPTPPRRRVHGSGLDPTSVWWLTFATPRSYLASVTDIASARSDDGGERWMRAGDDGLSYNTTYQVIGGADGALYAAASSVHDLYQSGWLTDDRLDGAPGRPARGAILVSRDAGAHFTTLEDLGHPVVALALDRERLYAAVVHSRDGGVYRRDLRAGPPSTARSVRLPSPPRTQGHPYTLRLLADGSLLASYSARREGTAGRRGPFTESAGVFLLPPGGGAWLDRSAPAMRRWTRDVAVDPRDPSESTWLAGVFSAEGDGAGGLYRTHDRGLTWQRISPTQNVESCFVDPRRAGHAAWLATEGDGLFFTADLGAEEPRWTRADDYPFAHPLRLFANPFDPGELWTTSFGGGLRVLHD